MERGHGSQIRGPGADRNFQPAPYPEREQARQASRPQHGHGREHDDEQVQQLGDRGGDRGPSRATASRITRTSPRPLPPLPWVCAPSGCPIGVLLLVPGGGLPPVADLAGGPVNGPRTAALRTSVQYGIADVK
jgi:hypothetical protein